MKLIFIIILLIQSTLTTSKNSSFEESTYGEVRGEDSQSESRGLEDFSPDKDIIQSYNDLINNYDKKPSKDLGEIKSTYKKLYDSDLEKHRISNLEDLGVISVKSGCLSCVTGTRKVAVVGGKELEIEEAVALFDYTWGERVNKFLRSIAKLKDDPKTIFENLTKVYQPRQIAIKPKDEDEEFAASMMLDLALCHLMQNGLKKLLKYEGTVYRIEKVWGDKEAFKKFYKENGIIRMDAFTSTRRTDEAMKKLEQDTKSPSNVFLEIKLDKSGADISALSAYPSQEEVLVKAGAFFTVKEVKISKKKDEKSNIVDIYNIILEEVPNPN